MSAYHDPDSLLRAQLFELSQPADRYTVTQLKRDHEEQYDAMVDTIAREAVERFGRQDNNWLKIIPELIHTLANDVSERGYSIVKHEDVRPANSEYQDTMFVQLFTEYDDTPEQSEQEQQMTMDPLQASKTNKIMSVTTKQLNGMSHVEMMKRMTQLNTGVGETMEDGMSTVQYKDPWSAARARKERSKKQVDQTEKPNDL